MAISRLRARLGAGARIALIGLALAGAVAIGCGKPAPAPEPGPRAAVTESEKTERPSTKGPEKKVVLGLTDLTPVGGAGWEVQADPLPAVAARINLRDAIRFDGEVVVPSAPYPFLATRVPGAKKKETYRAHNLGTMDAIGEQVVLPPPARAALSPDGKYLAARGKGKEAGVIEVFATETGKSVFRRDFLKEEKMTPACFDVLSNDRLWVAGTGDAPRVQLWGLEGGTRLLSFEATVRRASDFALSPNGRYLLTVRSRGPFVFTIRDLETGKVVGERAFQPAGAPAGAPAGLSFSPDGEEVTMLWRLAQPAEEVWGRLACWSVATGKKVHDSPIPVADIHSDIDALTQTDKRVVQFWPGRKGWMLFGYQLVDRETGAVVRIKELSLPRNEGDMQDRRFLDAGHVTEAARNRVPRVVKVIALPQADIAAAIKEAKRR